MKQKSKTKKPMTQAEMSSMGGIAKAKKMTKEERSAEMRRVALIRHERNREAKKER